MKKYICSILCLMLGPGGAGLRPVSGAVPPQGTIEIQVRGIPSDDATAISGQYLLDGNGTIRMPQLPPGQDVLRVVGKTARQIEDMLMGRLQEGGAVHGPYVSGEGAEFGCAADGTHRSGKRRCGYEEECFVAARHDASGGDCGRRRHHGLGIPLRAGDARWKNRDV